MNHVPNLEAIKSSEVDIWSKTRNRTEAGTKTDTNSGGATPFIKSEHEWWIHESERTPTPPRSTSSAKSEGTVSNEEEEQTKLRLQLASMEDKVKTTLTSPPLPSDAVVKRLSRAIEYKDAQISRQRQQIKDLEEENYELVEKKHFPSVLFFIMGFGLMLYSLWGSYKSARVLAQRDRIAEAMFEAEVQERQRGGFWTGKRDPKDVKNEVAWEMWNKYGWRHSKPDKEVVVSTHRPAASEKATSQRGQTPLRSASPVAAPQNQYQRTLPTSDSSFERDIESWWEPGHLTQPESGWYSSMKKSLASLMWTL